MTHNASRLATTTLAILLAVVLHVSTTQHAAADVRTHVDDAPAAVTVEYAHDAQSRVCRVTLRDADGGDMLQDSYTGRVSTPFACHAISRDILRAYTGEAFSHEAGQATAVAVDPLPSAPVAPPTPTAPAPAPVDPPADDPYGPAFYDAAQPPTANASAWSWQVRTDGRTSWVLYANRAGADDWDAMPGIGPVLAGRIMDARAAGQFTSVDDLAERVSGIGPAKATILGLVTRYDWQS